MWEGTALWKFTGQLFLAPSNKDPIYLSPSFFFFNSFLEKPKRQEPVKRKVRSRPGPLRRLPWHLLPVGRSFSSSSVQLVSLNSELSESCFLLEYFLTCSKAFVERFSSFTQDQLNSTVKTATAKSLRAIIALTIFLQGTLWEQLRVSFIEAECHVI